MVRYPVMKRVTQLLASILFIITVLTVYLAFDFAVNTAVSNNYSSHKHHHHHEDDIKVQKSTSNFFLPKLKKSNQTLNSDPEHHHRMNQERRTRSTKSKSNHIRLSQFHKSKTGIKIDHIKKTVKKQHRLSTTKINLHKDDRKHV